MCCSKIYVFLSRTCVQKSVYVYTPAPRKDENILHSRTRAKEGKRKNERKKKSVFPRITNNKVYLSRLEFKKRQI